MCLMLYCNIVDIVQGFRNLVPEMLLHVETTSQVQEATSEGLNLKTFLGEHTPRMLRSSVIHMINSFLSLTKNPA